MAKPVRTSKPVGKLALPIALGGAIAGLVGGLAMTVVLVQNLAAKLDDAAVSRGWTIGLVLTMVVGAAAFGIAWLLAGKVAARVAEVGRSVGKIGRGGAEVRVRLDGNDEVTALGRSVQALASDLSALMKDQQQASGGLHVSMDPLVQQLRDKTVPQKFPEVAGYEVDGAMSNGSRGGLDYFDVVAVAGETPTTVAYVVSAEGHGALSVVAMRMARDELHRAFLAGANPRKALAHTNKVCKTHLPTGVCAKATVLQFGQDGAKLYQAGARTPLLICHRGEVLELNAEGLAIGLDDGPVFEKSLRPQEIEMSPGIRLVLGNDALLRAGACSTCCASIRRGTRACS
ncbi:MAG: SpoIIE family protein phosphatase [Planctomycetota bacterium]